MTPSLLLRVSNTQAQHKILARHYREEKKRERKKKKKKKREKYASVLYQPFWLSSKLIA